jgi:membrane protein DedA with SNARE-associated domain
LDRIIAILPAIVSQNPLPFAFCFLLLFGFVLPISEEIAVALVGVTAHATGTKFVYAALVAMAAILLQDAAYFVIARLFGPRIIRHRLLSKIVTDRSIESGERYFKRRGPVIVFTTRFVVGIRAPVILSAGFLRMPWLRFTLYDTLAAAVMTPAWLYVGWALGSQFGGNVGLLSKVFSVLAPAAIILGAVLIYRSVKADKAKVEEEEAREGPASAGGLEA